MLHGILSVLLRLATLGSKFFLIILMAKFLSVTDFALYGLFTVTVGYSVYLVGFDFYNFTTRELVYLKVVEWGGVFKAQFFLTIALYVVFVPVLSVLFVFGVLPLYLFSWFLALLLVEHFCQEITRVLISASCHLAASGVIFIRTGAWALVAALIMVFFPESRVLPFLLGAWLVGGVTACILGVACLSGLKISGWSERVDVKIIRRGIKIALPLLVSTLAMRAIFTIDRYMIEAYSSSVTLAAYVLFAGIATTLMSLLDAAVFFPAYPKLIKYHNERNVFEFKNEFKRMFVLTALIAIAFAVFSGVAIEYVLQWLGRPVYIERLALFYWVLGAMVIYSLGMVPHYGLYAQKMDAQIIICHCLSVIIFIGSGLLLAGMGGEASIPQALCATFIFIFVWKLFFFMKANCSWGGLVRVND